jgi:hypothetical protein
MAAKSLQEIKEELQGISDVVLDGGLLLEYFDDSNASIQIWMNNTLFFKAGAIQLHAHELARAEVFYITCRNLGIDGAKSRVLKLKDFIDFRTELALTEIAGEIKCGHSIALADCFSIATGMYLNCPVMFKEEKELTAGVISSIQEQFNVHILVLSRP